VNAIDLNTVVRGEPELAASPEWRERLRYEMGHGAGLTDAEADEVAESVQQADVVTYAAALLQPCVNHIRMHIGELETLVRVDAPLQGVPA